MDFDGIPSPPDIMFEPEVSFRPDPDAADWILETFITGSGELVNPEHEHLKPAYIGVLWTNAPAKNKGRTILGTAEKPKDSASKWPQQRGLYQLHQWFGDLPDFIITLSAPYFARASNPQRCALIEHELYHCAQKTNQWGAPAFSKQTGRPLYKIRGHDVEEFVGVVRRYGAEASGVKELVEAANKGPQIQTATIEGICGTCRKKVA